VNRIGSLRALLRDCFRKDELEIFLSTIDSGVVRAVTWEQGEALVFEDALSALQRYGVINAEFWNRLVAERGGRKEEIRDAQRAWNGRVAEDDISPGASVPPLVARRDDLFALRRELKALEIPTSGLDEEIEDVERRLGLGVGIDVGATIAGVRLLELLTHGPLGSSWRAWHVTRKLEVRVRFASTSTVLMAHALTGLRHPNLLEIIPADMADANVPAGTTVLVTEWVPSASLRDRTVPVPLTTALEWAAQIAGALRVVHDAGRVHGAISPDTVAVARDNSMRLVAPGLLTDGLIGTIAPRDAHRRLVYAPPEAWTEPAPPTPGADVYAVGMLLAWLLTGREPLFENGDARAAWLRQIDAPDSVRKLLVSTTAGAAERVAPAALQERLDAATRWHQPVPEPVEGYLPAIHLVNGRLRDPFPPSVAWVGAHRDTIERLLPSVGLVLAGSQQREVALAVLVAPDLVAVPRHMVESLDYLFLDQKERQAMPPFKLSPGTDLETPVELSIRFSDPDAVRRVTRIAMIHPVWNLAFLRLDGSADRPPAPLLATAPTRLDGEAIVIGWPTRDRRMNEAVQSHVTGNVFSQKMVLPGRLLGLKEQVSFSRKVESLATYIIVGAGAGAPVVDLDAGAVAGLTFGAQYSPGSFSVPVWHLRRDPKVVSLGLSFLASNDVVAPDPVIEEAWNPPPQAPTMIE
jgi:serine/threonine protein kinase